MTPARWLNTLAKIMDKFDIEEIKENPGLFGKLFGNLRKQLDKILAKYHTMGDEVDKIYVQLKQYEATSSSPTGSWRRCSRPM